MGQEKKMCRKDASERERGRFSNWFDRPCRKNKSLSLPGLTNDPLGLTALPVYSISSRVETAIGRSMALIYNAATEQAGEATTEEGVRPAASRRR